ncbi:hypothetical protein STEG23_017275 [Scotinomys teguina]
MLPVDPDVELSAVSPPPCPLVCRRAPRDDNGLNLQRSRALSPPTQSPAFTAIQFLNAVHPDICLYKPPSGDHFPMGQQESLVPVDSISNHFMQLLGYGCEWSMLHTLKASENLFERCEQIPCFHKPKGYKCYQISSEAYKQRFSLFSAVIA